MTKGGALGQRQPYVRGEQTLGTKRWHGTVRRRPACCKPVGAVDGFLCRRQLTRSTVPSIAAQGSSPGGCFLDSAVSSDRASSDTTSLPFRAFRAPARDVCSYPGRTRTLVHNSRAHVEKHSSTKAGAVARGNPSPITDVVPGFMNAERASINHSVRDTSAEEPDRTLGVAQDSRSSADVMAARAGAKMVETDLWAHRHTAAEKESLNKTKCFSGGEASDALVTEGQGLGLLKNRQNLQDQTAGGLQSRLHVLERESTSALPPLIGIGTDMLAHSHGEAREASRLAPQPPPLFPPALSSDDEEWHFKRSNRRRLAHIRSLALRSRMQEEWKEGDLRWEDWVKSPGAGTPNVQEGTTEGTSNLVHSPNNTTTSPSKVLHTAAAMGVPLVRPSPTIFPIPGEALRALVPLSGSGTQVLQHLGGPLDWLRRFVLSMGVAVMLYNVSPLFTIVAAFYWAWAPIWSAALSNIVVRTKYPFAGLWVGRVGRMDVFRGPDGTKKWQLFIVDKAGVSVEVVADAPSLPAKLSIGEPIQMVAVSDVTSFSRFRLLREAFLPRCGVWVAQEAAIERPVFESLQLRLVPAVLNKLPSADDEDWDSLFSMLCDETSETLRQYKYEEDPLALSDGEGGAFDIESPGLNILGGAEAAVSGGGNSAPGEDVVFHVLMAEGQDVQLEDR